MHYIYDVLVNFNDIYFDFYDWNDDDNIIHVKKLPIFKVDSNFFYSVKYSDVVVDHALIEKIYRKTEFFNCAKDKYSYVCCLCDGREAFIVNFNFKGSVIGRSSMLIDEENEVIDICESLSFCKFNIIINSSLNPSFFRTRYESDVKKYILNQLDCLSFDELCYIYFDCFDECESDIYKINERIRNEIDYNFNYLYGKISDFLGLISINK